MSYAYNIANYFTKLIAVAWSLSVFIPGPRAVQFILVLVCLRALKINCFVTDFTTVVYCTTFVVCLQDENNMLYCEIKF